MAHDREGYDACDIACGDNQTGLDKVEPQHVKDGIQELSSCLCSSWEMTYGQRDHQITDDGCGKSGKREPRDGCCSYDRPSDEHFNG